MGEQIASKTKVQYMHADAAKKTPIKTGIATVPGCQLKAKER